MTNNPYQLATDIYGIGFITADKIARNLGVPSDSEFRYRAGLTHVLSTAAEDGHCYLPQNELIVGAIAQVKSRVRHRTPNNANPTNHHMMQYMMLSRNLLYTGLTRAKKLAIIIGSQKAIGMAVRSVNQKERYTQLQQRLSLAGLLSSQLLLGIEP